ncbi:MULTISPECIES: hypothetical protein [Rhodobacterales]|jgi:hypothetical protein|uniref:hypothetical protein n=2 Tax=Alphaproteobacteria TaxID=28211 RepID=UPI000068B201|nr:MULTISPECIES: hypothetical protein [Rhodobacterales]EAQ43752.1 hypothetical protein MED193_02080 [Roseobacter sp. MED193]OAN74450.1 hypothetical protein A8B81_04440 [Sulfitobacter pontiacus]ULO22046.1 hypothetical protein IV89_003417 [Sulfitobacter sp. CB2047]|tara:strand:+ start:243 stop:428 length:186 start_codon:yes stop_codon:yes gene_type:complete
MEMLLESFIQKLAKAMGHVCNVHRDWQTAPLHLGRALLIETKKWPFLSRFVHCVFSNRVKA